LVATLHGVGEPSTEDVEVIVPDWRVDQIYVIDRRGVEWPLGSGNAIGGD
jgi:hypothetical protein